VHIERSVDRDRAHGRHAAEAHLLPASREDEGEGLGAKLVEAVRGEHVRDDVHLVEAAGRVLNDDLLDVVYGLEGRGGGTSRLRWALGAGCQVLP
jgi:hypothetical protein